MRKDNTWFSAVSWRRSVCTHCSKAISTAQWLLIISTFGHVLRSATCAGAVVASQLFRRVCCRFMLSLPPPLRLRYMKGVRSTKCAWDFIHDTRHYNHHNQNNNNNSDNLQLS